MTAGMSASGPTGIQVPAKVQAAQSYLHYAHQIQVPPSSPFSSSGDMPPNFGVLTSKEQAAYDAALDVLIAYFRGEMEFGDTNSGVIPVDRPDDPKDSVPVN